MKQLGIVGGLILLAAACAPGDRWSSRVEDPGLPPLAPDLLLRKPADFKLYDHGLRKEYYLYFYEDDRMKEDVVVVLDHAVPGSQPRFATREEHVRALELFQAEWKARGDHSRLRYFNERYGAEKRRKDSLLDDEIVYKEREVKELEEHVIHLEADVLSRKDTGTFAAGDEKLHLAPEAAVQAELARAQRRLAVSQAQLLILEYRRALRDDAGRVGVEMSDARVRVGDLLPFYERPEQLVEEIRRKVTPVAWMHRDAELYLSGDELRVTQTSDVIVRVRDYVDRLRAEARRKLATPGRR